MYIYSYNWIKHILLAYNVYVYYLYFRSLRGGNRSCENYLDVCCYLFIVDDNTNIGHNSSNLMGSNITEVSEENTFLSQIHEIFGYNSNDTSLNEQYLIGLNSSNLDINNNNTNKDTFLDEVEKIFFINSTVISNKPYRHINNNSSTQDNYKCGIFKSQVYDDGFDSINYAKYGEFPSIVAIFNSKLTLNEEKRLLYHCGGSLVKENVILTSAQCMIK